MQPEGGVEGEPLLGQQLGGCQACAGQPHEVKCLQTHRLYRLSLQASDLPEGEAGDDAADWLLDHERLGPQALRMGRSVGSR